MFSIGFLVVCFLARPIVGIPQDYFTGIVDEINQFLTENHFDSLDLRIYSSFSWFIFSFEIKGIYAGNVSTLTIYDTQVISHLEEKNTTYQLKIRAGWPLLKAGLDYSTSMFPFSFPGTIILYDTGITFLVIGEIVEEDGTCKGKLINVELEDLGEVQLTVEPSSIINRLIKQLTQIWVNVFNKVFIKFIKNRIQDTIKLYMLDYRLPQIEIPCSYLDLA